MKALLCRGCARLRVAEPPLAYAAIVLLQLKVVWGMWARRDLTTGDTAAYFAMASGWHFRRTVNIAWSPLYTSFYGSLLHFSPDPYVVTTAHRLLIVLVAAVLVLALMRCLLAPWVAWLMAAWWAVLPINHDTLYEVHLFAVIPVLAAYLLLLDGWSRKRRAAAVGLLLAASILVRNELIVPTGLLALACVAFEVWGARAGSRPPVRVWRVLGAYALPTAAAIVVALLFYARSTTKYPALSRGLERKHTLNVCQIYAFGYQQRHPDWTGSPWLECQQLMMATFWHPEPSMKHALRLNPPAMREHFAWNIGLIPSGMQVLLFNATWGRVNPDYAPVVTRSRLALVCACLTTTLWLLGMAKLVRERELWWREWLRPRAWTWMLMAFLAASTTLVMIMQRPRPSYMFGFGVACMAATGLCLQAVTRGWVWVAPLSRWYLAGAALLILVAPGHYRRRTERPLLEAYRRLAPFADVIHRPGRVLVTPGYGGELCFYLRGETRPDCDPLDYYTLRASMKAGASWADVLRERGANMFYGDEVVLADAAVRGSRPDLERDGWEVVVERRSATDNWFLLQRKAAR